MKSIISYVLAFILTTCLIGVVVYYFFSNQFFLPWNQNPDESFLSEPEVVYDEPEFSDFERSDIGATEATEVTQPYQENEVKKEIEQTQGPKEVVVASYFSNLNKPRMMALSPYGDVVVSDVESGAVYALIDENADYKADKKITIIKDLKNPHGLAFNGDDLYIAETDKVRVLRKIDKNYKFIRNDLIIKDLTNFDGHFTRSLLIDNDKLYVSVGSSCNACQEKEENRAKVLRYNLDGTGKEVFSDGLRNAVGLTASTNGKIYATENGRDWLGDDLPSDEINILEFGKSYGWPYCYDDQVRDKTIDGDYDCFNSTNPFYKIKPHSAPLGLSFYHGVMFNEFEGDLLVALHGSWNSKEPVGYQVMRYEFNGSYISQSAPLLDIFLKDKQVKGRPVDVLVGKGGEIYISDDFAGKVYVMYKK